MRLVIQRVTSASVRVDGSVVGEIQQGLHVLVGVMGGDTVADAERCARKLVGLKLWPGSDGKPWKSSVKDEQRGVGLASIDDVNGVEGGVHEELFTPKRVALPRGGFLTEPEEAPVSGACESTLCLRTSSGMPLIEWCSILGSASVAVHAGRCSKGNQTRFPSLYAW